LLDYISVRRAVESNCQFMTPSCKVKSDIARVASITMLQQLFLLERRKKTILRAFNKSKHMLYFLCKIRTASSSLVVLHSASSLSSNARHVSNKKHLYQTLLILSSNFTDLTLCVKHVAAPQLHLQKNAAFLRTCT
jgi:hypothetical protein